jgi:pimeloyl-ACP methyl ester carboxylesterase
MTSTSRAAEPAASLHVEPFSINIGEEVLADLRARIRRTRWPDPAPAAPWEQGTDLRYLRELLTYWADEFDWRVQEQKLNELEHFRVEIDGVGIHFVHQRTAHGHGIPLILTHGWPSSFLEFLQVIPLLTDPAAHGIDGPAFDVVVPSLPGYAFSQRPSQPGVTTRNVAGLWHRLMRGLGYQRYGAHGTDFGAGVATFMAMDEPAPMLGLHLSNLEFRPYTGPRSRPLSEAEQAYVAQVQRWDEVERGYSSIQSTKPQTVAYGLTDSPAGLAAWLLEKWRSWSDSDGDLEGRFSRDFLLTVITLYWVTHTAATSVRDYFDNRWALADPAEDDYVDLPTGVAVFDHHFVSEGSPPREWAERLYAIRRWTPMPRGGHFAAVEEPELLARDIAAFFADPLTGVK